MKNFDFDFYEFTTILVPGAVMLTGFMLVYPDLRAELFPKDLSVGGLGFLAILAYAAGQLVQALGNILERLWWWRQGRPIDWVRTKKAPLMSETQLQALREQLPAKLGFKGPIRIEEMTAGAWSSITRQVYAAVETQSRARRADIFNGNYGLNRGLTAAFLVCAVLTYPQDWRISLALVGAACGALYRMHRFAKAYARELFVQFIQLPAPREWREEKEP